MNVVYLQKSYFFKNKKTYQNINPSYKLRQNNANHQILCPKKKKQRENKMAGFPRCQTNKFEIIFQLN